MLAERFLSTVVGTMAKSQLVLKPTPETHFPAPEPGRKYMLYLHVPFCQVLCPYCSFNPVSYTHLALPTILRV